MRGLGELLSDPLDMPPLAALLVNPGVPLATRDVFAALSLPPAGESGLAAMPSARAALIDFLKAHGNDLTQAAIARARVVDDMLKALAALPGAELVRMSGSGPTCFALFTSSAEAAAAGHMLSAARQDWWVHSGSIGQADTSP
jgi:4-diphosphocytidyl-2-C-methyl-D-erythritol kinase